MSIEELLKYDTSTPNGYVNRKEKIKRSVKQLLQKDDDEHNECIVANSNVEINEHGCVNGTQRDRNLLRKELLLQLEGCHPTEDKYENLVDQLIDLEEGFINLQ